MTDDPDRLLPLTRALLVTGIALTGATGAGLWLLPSDTEDYWAWTIQASPSASFLGAGYVGASVGLVVALVVGHWRRARAMVLTALVFTTVALITTARHPGPFEWGGGAEALPRAAALTWLVVYVALPPVAALVLVLQDRRAVGNPSQAPLGVGTTAALLAAGSAIGAVGLLLLAEWGRMLAAWPWPLTPLTADLVGAWLVTASAALLWIALRERDGVRARATAVGGAVFALLALVAALRSWDELDGGRSTAVYVGGVALASVGLLAFVIAAYRTAPRGSHEPYRPTS